MDLRIYYQKIRETEAEIADEFPIVVSAGTSDGGKAGTKTEVSRWLGAKLVVDGAARLASAEEAKRFREEARQSKRRADEAAAAGRVQFTVVSTADLERLKGTTREAKA